MMLFKDDVNDGATIMPTLIARLCAMFLLFSPFVLAQNYADTFGRLPLVKQMQISPKGDQIAYLRDMKKKYYLIVQHLFDAKKQPVVFAMDDGTLRNFVWGNNDNIVFTVTRPYHSKADFETFTMYRTGILNVSKNKAIWPFTSTLFDFNIDGPRLVSKLANDPEHVLMSYWYKSMVTRKPLNTVYKVRLADGDRTKYFQEPESGNWIFDIDGNVKLYRAWSDKHDKRLVYIRLKNDEDDFVPVTFTDGDEEKYLTTNILGYDQKKHAVYYYDVLDNGTYVIEKGMLKGAHIVDAETVSENKFYDVDTISRDYHSRMFNGYNVVEDVSKYVYFDKTLATVQADLVATFEGADVKITSYSNDKNRFLVRVSGPANPEEYYFYDRQQGAIQMMGEGFPMENKALLGNVERFDFTSEDGDVVTGYLTLPVKAQEHKLPLIVMPHGGPEARDTAEFDWMRQFYATNGYAVYQPNFRGSSGFGETFAEKGYGQWGRLMQQDVDAGVAHLIAKKNIDKSRICVVGSSYGGYVAMYSATTRQHLYKCAVSYAGISELSTMLYHAEEQKVGLDYWQESIGTRWEQDELRAHSPLFQASSKTLPLLLIHGDKDTTVPLFQSEKMIRKLKEVGASDSKYIELEGEDHWLSSGESRRLFLAESLKFVQKHI